MALVLVAFGGAGAWLLRAGRRDRRAIDLGLCFVLIASLYADQPLRFAATASSGVPRQLWAVAAAVQICYLAPYFLWRFVRSFPDAPLSFSLQRSFRIALRVVLAAGLIVGIVATVRNLAALRDGGWAAAGATVASAPTRSAAEILLLSAGSLAALAVMVGRWRSAPGEERRRIALLVSGLAVGMGPLLAEIVAEVAIPAYGSWVLADRKYLYLATIYFPLLLSIPFTAAWSVVTHQALDVRLLAREAAQYALARYAVLVAALTPAFGLGWYIYAYRDSTVAELATGSSAILLAVGAGLGLAAWRYHEPVLDALDRRFFREQFDAHQLLATLVEQLRGAPDAPSLARWATAGIDSALHVESASLLLHDPVRGALVDPRGRCRPLDAASALVALVSASPEPLAVDFEQRATTIAHLPELERHWLVDCGVQLLLPLVDHGGALLAVLAVGAARSGLPFLRDDRKLLRAVASSASVALELIWVRQSWPNRRPGIRRGGPPAAERSSAEMVALVERTAPDAPARECFACGRLYPPGEERCPACDAATDDAPVPYVLPDRYRFEQRIGSGGMGVVYRATDLALGRTIAVKALPRVTPEQAQRLRREARAAAAVSHPNLSAIYGLEPWRGTPLLVFEYIDDGTLPERLRAGHTLPPIAAHDLGLALPTAHERIHAVGVLHRDIKPSNIGFMADGTPKLLDFGVARLQHDLRADSVSPATLVSQGAGSGASLGLDTTPITIDATGSRQMIGTPAYLSPEVLAGEPADVRLDLWSLAVVLWESLCGRNLFAGSGFNDMIEQIRAARVPDLRAYLPGSPAALDELFRGLLARDPAHRPATASELRQRLLALRKTLPGGLPSRG